ncbi:MAG: YceD family protein [Gammaproteobacteria bacterium]|nr:YceD family protein [Gammaproteobacteria bacterium]
MLTGPLPEQVDHRKLVSDRAILQGIIPLHRFSRLARLLESDVGNARIRLEFRKRKRQQTMVVGKARFEASLICQACLESLKIPLEIGVRLILVSSEQELLDLKQSEDGLVIDAKLVKLVDLLEDEFIVSLPMVPRHNFGTCGVFVEMPQQVDIEETYRPFAALPVIQEDTN